jgi:hypothetical protein
MLARELVEANPNRSLYVLETGYRVKNSLEPSVYPGVKLELLELSGLTVLLFTIFSSLCCMVFHKFPLSVAWLFVTL